jgi:GntR family transcriptional regulator
MSWTDAARRINYVRTRTHTTRERGEIQMTAAKGALRIVRGSPDLNRSPVARYIQLATLFRNWIASGEWPIGGRIPNVDELASEFAVARGTIRDALGMLEEEGLLERLRAKGTFVRKSPLDVGVHKLAIDWQSIISAHEGAEIKVIEHRVLGRLPALDTIKGNPAPKYQMMRRLHLRQGKPYLVGRFYLEYELFKQGPPLQFRRLPTLPILHKIAGSRIGKAWQTLTIGMADIEIASLLQIPLNSPIAQVHRVAVDRSGTILYVGHGVYRGDAISLEMELI